MATLKTLTTTRGHRVRTSTVTHLLVRRVYRGGHTVSATDGTITVDLSTFADADQAHAEAGRLAARTGLPVRTPATWTAPTLAEGPGDLVLTGGYGGVQPVLPLG